MRSRRLFAVFSAKIRHQNKKINEYLERIVMAGYREQDHLVAAYRAIDVLIYPIPGSDKSCWTVYGFVNSSSKRCHFRCIFRVAIQSM